MKKMLEKVPLYPFLVAVYPILFLLSVNISEINPMSGFRSALLFLAIGLLVFGFFWGITRSAQKSGMITLGAILTFFLIFFAVYAPAYRALREVTWFGSVLGRHRYLIPSAFILLILVSLVVFFIVRNAKPRRLRAFTLWLNILAILLVLIPVVTMLSDTIKKSRHIAQTQASLPPIEQPLENISQPLPDIYYIILDMHTSDRALLEFLDYDDSKFTNALTEKGFYVAGCSKSNYPSTQASLTSSMNMDYIQDLVDDLETSRMIPLMKSSRVRRMLEDVGYQTYAFESGYSYTDLEDASHFYRPVSSAWDLLSYPGVTPFESLILQVSGGKILYETRDNLSKRLQYILDASYVQYRDRILFALDTLEEIPSDPGPKFVFAHILAPHDPFVFDENGNPAFRRTPFSLNEDPEYRAGYGWEEYRVAYVKELKYLHQRVLEVVDAILEQSATPPVIIIQGDHGIPRSAIYDAQFEIYNAYNFGDQSSTQLYDAISPVNSFRVLFNTLFSTSYPLLPDEAYLVDYEIKTYELFEKGLVCPQN